MNNLCMDLHIHTDASFDSYDSIEAKIKKAEKLGLDIIAITDHNSIDNALKAQEFVSKAESKVKIIVGEEVSTDKGEIIGLFLKKYINPNKIQVVLEDIKSQGGLVYLPHPFKRNEIIKTKLIDDIDIIEVWNARCSYEQNYKALIYTLQHDKAMACGSDSHIISEIGRCRMIVYAKNFELKSLTALEFLNLLKNASKITIIGSNNNFIKLECLSQLIKCVKKRTLLPIKYLIRYIPSEFIYNKGNPSSINILLEKTDDKLAINVR